MSEIKDYKEPWEYERGDIFGEDAFVYSKTTGFTDEAMKIRAVACVNALAERDPSKLAALETALEDYIIAHEKWEADVILYDESGDPRTEPPRLTKELYEGAIVVQTKRHEALAALAAFRGETE